MTLDQAMADLKALGNEKLRPTNTRNGSPDNQFGVQMGDIRGVAKKIKSDHALGLELWKTGTWEAMLLATLVMKPKEFSAEELDRLVRSVHRPSVAFSQLADWLMTNVVRAHPQKEQLREKWMAESDVMAARAGWSLTAERIVKSPDGLDIPGILDRIEREMGDAPAPSQWTMNTCLYEIGVNLPEFRERAIAIGEKLGVYRDFPCSKGCISPYAPTAIVELVKRKA